LRARRLEKNRRRRKEEDQAFPGASRRGNGI
jgi:hypothetical protein